MKDWKGSYGRDRSALFTYLEGLCSAIQTVGQNSLVACHESAAEAFHTGGSRPTNDSMNIFGGNTDWSYVPPLSSLPGARLSIQSILHFAFFIIFPNRNIFSYAKRTVYTRMVIKQYDKAKEEKPNVKLSSDDTQ